ncbi:MAG: hypothetical protein GF364_00480, partial [Candidatus Lokiarchaeota archaeon]|nr:hypothetical protein [Candidatus Lokiarchaeota archaeon]
MPRNQKLAIKKYLIVSLLMLFTISNFQGFFAMACPPPNTDEITNIYLDTGYPTEEGTTGWVNETFRIRLFDTLYINWTSKEDGLNVIMIRNTDTNRIIYTEKLYLSAGNNTHSVKIDPITRLNSGFAPGSNITVQIYKYTKFLFIPILKGYSERQNAHVIKAKSKFEFISSPDYPDDEYDMGVFIIDNSEYPIDPHYQVNYQIKLVDYYYSKRRLVEKPIIVETTDTSFSDPDEYTEVTITPTDIHGILRYSEKRTSIQYPFLTRFTFLGNEHFEPTVIVDSLDPSHIFSSFDYSGPSTINQEVSNGSAEDDSYTVHSSTELRKVFSWTNSTDDKQGFLLNNISSWFYTFGTSTKYDSLYIGSYSGIDLEATIISPAIYYYADEVTSANISVHFATVHDINGLEDEYSGNNLFDIDLLLLDQDNQIIELQSLFIGNFSEFLTRTVNLNLSSFSQPNKFRIGFRIIINPGKRKSFLDFLDEYYFAIKSIDFHLIYPNPKWGTSGHLSDWNKYTFQQDTKKIDFTQNDMNDCYYLTNLPPEDSSINDPATIFPIPISSPLDEGLTAFGIQDYSFKNNPFSSLNTWGIDSANDGFDYACGNRAEISTLNDYFEYGSDSYSGVEFYYHLYKYVWHREFMTSVPEFRFSNNAENRWAALSIPFMIPKLGDTIDFDNIEIIYDVASNKYISPGNQYRIRALILAPDHSIYDLYTSSWTCGPTEKDRNVIWSDFHGIGKYQLLLIAETKEWSNENKNRKIFFDNVEVKCKFYHTADEYKLSSVSSSLTDNNIDSPNIMGEFLLDNTIDFEDPGLTSSQVEFSTVYNPIQTIASSDDGTAEYSIELIPISQDNVELSSLLIRTDTISVNSQLETKSVDLSELFGTQVKEFKLRVWMRTPPKSIGYKTNKDLYQLIFTNISLKIDQTVILDWISESDVIFIPITMDSIAEKNTKSDPNRNSIIMSIPEQIVSSDSYSKVYSSTPLIDGSGLASTLFNGTLNLQLQAFVDSATISSVPINTSLLFELYVEDKNENLVLESSTMIWSKILSYENRFLFKEENISVNMTEMFVNYTQGEPGELDHYLIRLISQFKSTANGVSPAAGIEIKKSSLVLTDLPPQGIWANLSPNDILYGNKKLTIHSISKDTVAVRLLGSNDGISYYTINETYSHDENWNFEIQFDTANDSLFSPNDENFYLVAQLRDDYGITNTSVIQVILDNSAPIITFGDSLTNNEIIYEPKSVEINSDATDIEFVEFYADL